MIYTVMEPNPITGHKSKDDKGVFRSTNYAECLEHLRMLNQHRVKGFAYLRLGVARH